MAVNFNELEAVLISTTDGRVACDPINTLGSELRAWAAAGYPDAKEYSEPKRHAALKKPMTTFEKLVCHLDKKLAKQRKEQQDLAEPTDWLTIAPTDEIARITARWKLPSIYLDFLTRFSPLRVLIDKPEFFNPFSLFGASELIAAQDGYSFDPIGKRPLEDWPANFVVIANHGGDPYVLDLSKSDGSDAPVLTAEHGAGKWDFEPVAASFREFLEHLAK